MSKETFNEALYKNLPPLQEWQITRKELNKLWNNLHNSLPIKDIFSLNINKEILANPKSKVFFKNGGNPFRYICDIETGKYYPINSRKGHKIISRYV